MDATRLVNAMNRVFDEYAKGFYSAVDEAWRAAGGGADTDAFLRALVQSASAANEHFSEQYQIAVCRRDIDPSAVTQVLFGVQQWHVANGELHSILRYRNLLHHRKPGYDSVATAVEAAGTIASVLTALGQSHHASVVEEQRDWIAGGMPVTKWAAKPMAESSVPPPSAAEMQVRLSSEQLACCQDISNWLAEGTSRHFVVAGEAGSGKTTVLAQFLLQSGLDPARTLIATPTTKAKEVLRHKLPSGRGWRSRLRTLASVIWRFARPAHDGQDLVFTKTGTKSPASDHRLSGVSIVIVDEASMVTRAMHKALTDHYRVIYFGDADQLPPVIEEESKDVPADVLLNPDFSLKTIHRQADESPILQAAARAKRGDQLEFFEWTDERVSLLNEHADGVDSVEFGALVQTHDIVLAGRNVTRIAANQFIRKVRGFMEYPGDGIPKPGEILIATANMRDALDGGPIANGERLIVESCLGHVQARSDDLGVLDLRVQVFVEGEPSRRGDVIVSSQMLNGLHVRGSQIVTRDVSGPVSNILRCEWGYAVTVHKAQGSEWPAVLVLDDVVVDDHIQRSRWNYVAYSRAIERLTVLKLASRTGVFG